LLNRPLGYLDCEYAPFFNILFYLHAILCFVGYGLFWQWLLKIGLQVLFSKGNLILVNALVRAANTLIQELETKFLAHGVMDVFGILYPYYLLQLDYEASFPKHLEVIKTTFYSSKTQLLDGVKTFVYEVLHVSDLDS
jgi:hypothetical protein